MKAWCSWAAGLCLMGGVWGASAEEVAVESASAGVVGIWVSWAADEDNVNVTLGIYPDGTYAIDIDQDGEVEFRGTWKMEENEINLTTDADMEWCADIGATYRVEVDRAVIRFELILDACEQRARVMKRSWDRVPDIDLMAIQ